MRKIVIASYLYMLPLPFVSATSYAVITNVQQAEKIEVSGVVRGEKGERIAGATILLTSTGEILGATDDEGKFAIKVAVDAKLRFESMGYDAYEIELKGKRNINIKMSGNGIALDEVEVVATVKNKIIPEPTDIEIKGGYMHLKTKFKIPGELYNSHVRLIVQPSLANLTKKETDWLQAVVYDGRNFHLNQERMYGFDISQDPLHSLVEIKSVPKEGETVYYRDSIELKNMRDDYRGDVVMLIESYGKILYRDSFNIARGTVNPLRFLDYHALGQMAELDEKYLPKPEPAQREDKGVVDLQFEVGKSSINEEFANNQIELDKILSKLRSVEENELFELQSFYIKGYASPEGSYVKNKVLSEERTKAALQYIKNNISSKSLAQIYFEHDSEVQEWDNIIPQMISDSLTNEVEELRVILDETKDMDVRGRKIAQKKYYRPIIIEKYLPKLRKVEYQFTYSQLRELTDEEVVRQYKDEFALMTKHEFWRYYKLNISPKEEVLTNARSVYPKEIAFANELATLKLQKGTPDIDLLAPFINTATPEAVLLNHIAALFQENQIAEAQRVANFLPESSVAVRGVLDALNGNYEKAYEVFGQKKDRNNAVILLAMKRNEEALKLLKEINDQKAESYYLMAIAANRLDLVGEAMMYINEAIMRNPELEELAKIDGDVLDLLL